MAICDPCRKWFGQILSECWNGVFEDYFFKIPHHRLLDPAQVGTGYDDWKKSEWEKNYARSASALLLGRFHCWLCSRLCILAKLLSQPAPNRLMLITRDMETGEPWEVPDHVGVKVSIFPLKLPDVPDSIVSWYMCLCIGPNQMGIMMNTVESRKSLSPADYYLNLGGELMSVDPNESVITSGRSAQLHDGFEKMSLGEDCLDMIGESRWELLNSWLTTCRTDHGRCKRSNTRENSNVPLPTRLVKVTGTCNAVAANVVQTASLGHSEIAYATLSHCWGKAPVYRLTTDNLDGLLTSIPIDKLGATFKESLQLCRALGIDYIWIDSLCIIQNDDRDWQFEAQRMHHVYANSVLNLAASASRNCSQGLFTRRNPMLSKHPVIRMPNDLILTEEDERLSEELRMRFAESPLLKRGWVLQECFLAPRNLHWADFELTWQCNELFASESEPRGIAYRRSRQYIFQTPVSSVHTVEELDAVWQEIASSYQRAYLSKAPDKYHAVTGLATQFLERYRQLGVRTSYFAGCWEHSLVNWIIWSSVPEAAFLSQTYQNVYLPTWSWMNGCRYLKRGLPAPSSLAMSIESVDLVYEDPENVFGPLTSGVLTVTAPLFRFTSEDCIRYASNRPLVPKHSVFVQSGAGDAFLEWSWLAFKLYPRHRMAFPIDPPITCAIVSMETTDDHALKLRAMILSPCPNDGQRHPLYLKNGMMFCKFDTKSSSLDEVMDFFKAQCLVKDTFRLQ